MSYYFNLGAAKMYQFLVEAEICVYICTGLVIGLLYLNAIRSLANVICICMCIEAIGSIVRKGEEEETEKNRESVVQA